jgi:hypothetical protein
MLEVFLHLQRDLMTLASSVEEAIQKAIKSLEKEGKLWRETQITISFSREDVNGDDELIEQMAHQTRILVVTESNDGCVLYWNGDRRRLRRGARYRRLLPSRSIARRASTNQQHGAEGGRHQPGNGEEEYGEGGQSQRCAGTVHEHAPL